MHKKNILSTTQSNNAIDNGDHYNRWIVGFDHRDEISSYLLGGKGYNLIKLKARGIPVPDGFCITADAYLFFLKETGLDHKIAELLVDENKETAYTKIADEILNAKMPLALKAVISKAYQALNTELVAVRSSALEEDSEETSFAGQHSSYLNIAGIENVLDRIRACWASIWNLSARSYRSRQVNIDSNMTMAVVVQMMVNGEASGVAFSQHPISGDKKQLVIEACLGLGEGLVGGRIVSDNYVLEKTSLRLISSQVNHKITALAKGIDNKTVVIKVNEGQQNQPVLKEKELYQLGELIKAVTSFYEQPQDIEWTYEGEQFYILQCRPITATSSLSDNSQSSREATHDRTKDISTIWSRMDIGEIFTGRMTNLGISFAKYYQHNVHSACINSVGLRDAGDPAKYMGYNKGYVYLNVSYTAYLLSQTPPSKNQMPFISRFDNGDIDLKNYENPYGGAYSHHYYSRAKTIGYWLKTLVKEVFLAKRRSKKMVSSRYSEYDRAFMQDLSQWNLKQLNKEMDRCLNYFNKMHVGYLPFYINATGLYDVLQRLCSRWLQQDDARHMQNKLKGDVSNLRTIKSAHDIWQLCQSLNRYPAVKDILIHEDVNEIADMLNTFEQGRRFVSEVFADFMRENGVRANTEMELTSPRWVDDPVYIFKMVKTYLVQGNNIGEKLNGTLINNAHTEELLKKLPWFKRRLLALIIDMFSACSHMREETRMSMITSIWLIRRLVYEIGRRLTQEQILRNVQEVAHLDFADLLAYLKGDGVASQMFPREKIESIKQEYQDYGLQPKPPVTFIGNPVNHVAHALTNSITDIRGLGASQGYITGQARVIKDLRSQAEELKKGEIIVAEYTDASWTPLFALAGGIVTDIGSMLSHSSIVTREFGIPSVVNLRFATKIIKTGDLISVNGTTGVVEINVTRQGLPKVA